MSEQILTESAGMATAMNNAVGQAMARGPIPDPQTPVPAAKPDNAMSPVQVSFEIDLRLRALDLCKALDAYGDDLARIASADEMTKQRIINCKIHAAMLLDRIVAPTITMG